MAQWLMDDYKLTSSEVAQVLGTSAEYKVGEVADRNAGMILKINKERLANFNASDEIIHGTFSFQRPNKTPKCVLGPFFTGAANPAAAASSNSRMTRSSSPSPERPASARRNG